MRVAVSLPSAHMIYTRLGRGLPSQRIQGGSLWAIRGLAKSIPLETDTTTRTVITRKGRFPSMESDSAFVYVDPKLGSIFGRGRGLDKLHVLIFSQNGGSNQVCKSSIDARGKEGVKITFSRSSINYASHTSVLRPHLYSFLSVIVSTRVQAYKNLATDLRLDIIATTPFAPTHSLTLS